MNNGPTLSLGSTGKDIKRLQRILVMMHAIGVNDITGTFDAITKEGVKFAQEGMGVVADGIVGPATWHVLPADPNTPKLSIGSSGTAVSGLQSALVKNSPPGPSPGAIDGHFGVLTKAAVIFYQSERGLTPDGIVGDKTWWSSFGPVGPSLAKKAGLTSGEFDE